MRKNKVCLAFGILALIMSMAVFTGCTTTQPIENHAQFPADGSKYVILGRVTVQVDLAKASGGYMKLLDAAKEMYPNADDVVNVVMDAKAKRKDKIFRYVTLSGIAIDYVEVKN
ncbi:MAG: hypothetical protein P1P60_09310 [Treponema phagedenis]|uniref:hypothetical protein n=1 Tax=Treponema phagedenis TaxID=162 RepID=UPI000465AD75|nr:hypothetical protein [Treponema phagedenis]